MKQKFRPRDDQYKLILALQKQLDMLANRMDGMMSVLLAGWKVVPGAGFNLGEDEEGPYLEVEIEEPPKTE